MKRLVLSTGIVALLVGLAAPVRSGLVYDNGPIGGTNAFFIDASLNDSLSEQFTLAAPAALTSAQAGLWVIAGATPASVDWAVGTTPFASDLGSGTSTPTNVFVLGNVLQIFDVYESTFAINTGILSSGTNYYFTIVNAAPSDGPSIAWDESNGPSVAFHGGLGNLDGFGGEPGSHSESFQLFGTAVPAPTTSVVWLILFAIFGIGASCKRPECLAGGQH
jgi:hypothetical protein